MLRLYFDEQLKETFYEKFHFIARKLTKHGQLKIFSPELSVEDIFERINLNNQSLSELCHRIFLTKL